KKTRWFPAKSTHPTAFMDVPHIKNPRLLACCVPLLALACSSEIGVPGAEFDNGMGEAEASAATTVVSQDGTQMIIGSDGSVTTIDPDGTTTVQAPDGTVT